MSVTMIVDPATGDLTVEGVDATTLAEWAGDLLGLAAEVNCAMPLPGQVASLPTLATGLSTRTARVHRLYYGSVVDGPGRRAVLQMQGCPIRCPGCYVPQTHAADGGVALPVATIVDMLLDTRRGVQDGVSILGGEPFAQPEALLDIADTLVSRGVHVCVYSGYTLGRLLRAGSLARAILARIDLLIDGPYVAGLAAGAGEWRGSTNQQVRSRGELAGALAWGRPLTAPPADGTLL